MQTFDGFTCVNGKCVMLGAGRESVEALSSLWVWRKLIGAHKKVSRCCSLLGGVLSISLISKHR